MAVTADVVVFHDGVLPAAIPGVVVGVYDVATLAEVAVGVTDVNGLASFLLPGAASPGTLYEVRLFKLGVRFANPKRIAVIEPVVTTNRFDVSGTLLTLPTATDPRVCRCTGRFMNFSDRAVSKNVFRIMAKGKSGLQVPKIVDGNLVSSDEMSFQADADGVLTIDLLRGGEYFITFAGEDDTIWPIKVPDRASVNLIDLIHPQPISLTWNPTDAPLNAVSVAVGEVVEVHYSVLFSDFQTFTEGMSRWINFFNSDETMGSVFSGDYIAIQGLAVGSLQVTASMIPGLFPSRISDYFLTAPILTVTITPAPV